MHAWSKPGDAPEVCFLLCDGGVSCCVCKRGVCDIEPDACLCILFILLR